MKKIDIKFTGVIVFFKSERRVLISLFGLLTFISIAAFLHFYELDIVTTYNDAKSHLNIGRRVVDGLEPGMAQLGSVWLPLLHLLMTLTISSDFMWHSGLAGAIWSMLSFSGTGILVYLYLRELGVRMAFRLLGVFLFASNLNILYLQSTAMTESSLLFLMTAAAYYFLLWLKRDNIYDLVLTAFFIMVSTLVRYDGWFMLFFVTFLLLVYSYKKNGFKKTEGIVVLFLTLGGFGIFLWIIWNYLIFGDPLYFIFGPYSAHAQQESFAAAGLLKTKFNILLSSYAYSLAMIYNLGIMTLALGIVGFFHFGFSQKHSQEKIAILALFSPLFFNILALFLGHSILFIPEYINDTWFNVRYGIMVLPAIIIMTAYYLSRLKSFHLVLTPILILTIFFALKSQDSVVIDDGLSGVSHKDISLISQELGSRARNENGFVLIAVAANDTIVFSSGLPMSKFIHEGTGDYFKHALDNPSRWARWIVLEEYNEYDMIWHTLSRKPEFLNCYYRQGKYPHASLFVLKDECLGNLDYD